MSSGYGNIKGLLHALRWNLLGFTVVHGSWLHIWDRFPLNCINVLVHRVWSLVPRDITIYSIVIGRGTLFLETWPFPVQLGLICMPNAHIGNTFSLAWSHTGNLVFTGGEDRKIHMFEIYGQFNVLHVATSGPHTWSVYSLAFEFP